MFGNSSLFGQSGAPQTTGSSSVFNTGKTNQNSLLSANDGPNVPTSNVMGTNSSLFSSPSVPVGGSTTGGGELFGSTTSSAKGGVFSTSQQGSGLFGNLSTQPGLMPFGSTTTSQPSSSLFGENKTTSIQGSGSGLFGATGAVGQPAPNSLLSSTPTFSPFGSSTSTPATQAPTGGLFGSSASTTKPSSTIGGSSDTSAAQTGLFGHSPVANGGGDGSTVNNSTSFGKSAALFGGLSSSTNTTQAVASATEAKSGTTAASSSLFGGKLGADTSVKLGGSGLFGNISAPTANDPATKPSLFGGASNVDASGLKATGSEAVPSTTGTLDGAKGTSQGLFGTKAAESTAVNITGGLSGDSGNSSDNKTTGTTPMSTLFGAKKDEGSFTPGKETSSSASGVFGSQMEAKDKDTLKQQAASPFLPAFGSSTDTPKPSITKPTSVPSVETVKSTALESSQYQKVDDLMKHWDQRLKIQVSDFGRFSEAVMRLDLDLCTTVSALENVQQQQSLIEFRQQEIDASLDQIENHQVSLAKMLQQMESLLSSQIPSDSVHPLQGAVQSLSANLDDSEILLDELTEDINKVQESLYPGALGEVIDLVNVQQRSLERLSENCQQLRDRITALERV